MNETGFWRKVGLATGIVIPRPDELAGSMQRHAVVGGTAKAPVLDRNEGVSQGDALSLTAVYRAVSIISTAIVSMPLGVERGGIEIGTPSFIKSPSLNENRAVVIEQTVMSLALDGNAYWRLVRNGPDEPVIGIEVLNPNSVYIQTENAKVTGYSYGDKEFKPWQVKHLALMRIPGSPYGLGPIQAAQATLRGTRDVRDYASNWFRQGGMPNGVLSTEHVLTEEHAAIYKQRFEETQAQGHGVAVLGQGTTYQPIMLKPVDAQFLETQQFTRSEVALLFGIPAAYMLAQSGESQTYSNQQQVDIMFLKFTLAGYLREIEEAFSDLLPRGNKARFNPEGLLRTDTKSRYESFDMAIKAGWLLPSEVREIEGLPAVAGIDTRPVSNSNEGSSIE